MTCLFADLVGFTTRAESLDPEDVEAILRPYHERLRSELERHGGTVEEFIGDAVVALCGGADAGVTALNAMAFGVIGAIAPPGDDPAQAVRPFDARRAGTAGGEACGILVLEQLQGNRAARCGIGGHDGQPSMELLEINGGRHLHEH